MRGVYRTIADVNPVSHLYEGMRDLVIEGLVGRAPSPRRC